jgi:hypothetical protein
VHLVLLVKAGRRQRKKVNYRERWCNMQQMQENVSAWPNVGEFGIWRDELWRNFEKIWIATDQAEILKPTFWEMREKSAVQRAICVPTDHLTAAPREIRKTSIEFASWLTFISTIYRTLVPTTQRTQSVSFMKTNHLMLFSEATVIYGDFEL